MKNGAMNHLNATLSVSDTFSFAGGFPSALPRGDEGPEEGLLMPEWGYTITAIILFLIGFFGFFFNLIVIVLMYKDIQVSVLCCYCCCLPLLHTTPTCLIALSVISSGRRLT